MARPLGEDRVQFKEFNQVGRKSRRAQDVATIGNPPRRI